MTIEEIQQTLETLVKSQANHESRTAKLETAFQSVAHSLQLLIEMTSTHEERHDQHDEARIHTDARLDALIDAQVRADERMDGLIKAQVQASERMDALINAQVRADERMDALVKSQVGYEARQEKLEESFRQVAASHQLLIQLVRIQEERIDGHDEHIDELFKKNDQ